ncbi:MAG: purine-nucleoside phosphorylase [Planctomycetes bacterium]|nr:purine-nucleoside phosphorylase [Planctomycetota bacterium]
MTSFDRYKQFSAAARRNPPCAAVILGSGLNCLTQRLQPCAAIDYADIPGMPATTVAGHPGRLTIGTWERVHVLVFAGRLHRYEGREPDCIVRPVQVAHELGAGILLATNASGGIASSLAPPCLLAISEHLDCSRPSWWQEMVTPRNFSKPSHYSPALLTALEEAAAENGIALQRGVYAQVSGPNYETPAEVRALRVLGADVVGMSTVGEIEAARALGLECAAVSAVTNRAAGLASGPLSHDEVIANADRLAVSMARLLEGLLRRL